MTNTIMRIGKNEFQVYRCTRVQFEKIQQGGGPDFVMLGPPSLRDDEFMVALEPAYAAKMKFTPEPVFDEIRKRQEDNNENDDGSSHDSPV